MLQDVLLAYGFEPEHASIEPFGTGLINKTWKIAFNSKKYILQRVNDSVFKQPHYIESNIRLISDYLKAHHPDYLFASPIAAINERQMVSSGGGYFRVFPFIEGSHVINVVSDPQQAYEAARQFGRFTRLLAGIDMGKLKPTIPSFHDLTLRYSQFIESTKHGNPGRIRESQKLVSAILKHSNITHEYEIIKSDSSFKLRATHHDAKISNVLFDEKGNGLCVIDLDTAFPGYFMSDVGDMMRTYLSPADENENDIDKIIIRKDFYRAIVQGYSEEMKNELTEKEESHFFYSGKFMIYMQALRFLADYLNGDVYYKTDYPEHNLIRAVNQVTLLERFIEKEKEF